MTDLRELVVVWGAATESTDVRFTHDRVVFYFRDEFRPSLLSWILGKIDAMRFAR